MALFLQITLISCTDDSEIIKNENSTSKINKEDVESPDDRG